MGDRVVVGLVKTSPVVDTDGVTDDVSSGPGGPVRDVFIQDPGEFPLPTGSGSRWTSFRVSLLTHGRPMSVRKGPPFSLPFHEFFPRRTPPVRGWNVCGVTTVDRGMGEDDSVYLLFQFQT